MNNPRSEWITRLYKISAGLIGGYFVLCCLFVFVPQIPLRIFAYDLSTDTLSLPVKTVLAVRYVFVLPFAAFALSGIYRDKEKRKPGRSLVTAGVYYGIYEISGLNRLLANMVISRIGGVEMFSVSGAVQAFADVFGVLSRAGIILLFCGLAVDTYESSGHKAAQPPENV